MPPLTVHLETVVLAYLHLLQGLLLLMLEEAVEAHTRQLQMVVAERVVAVMALKVPFRLARVKMEKEEVLEV